MPNTRAIGVAYRDQQIVGGSVDQTPIGATTASTGAFTTLASSGATTLGDATTDLVGFHGSAGADQAAYTASLSINALSVSGVVGFTSSTSVSALVTAVNNIIALLVEKGLMAAA
jgi:hypothetical protein